MVRQYPDETARGARGCPWVAECEVEDVAYSARSRSGAPFALARILADAGIPDAPMVVVSAGLKGDARYRSFHEMAGYTIAESATASVRRTAFVPYEARSAAGMPQTHKAGGQKQGVNELAAVGVAADA